MREYNEMMLRPVLYPDGRVHDDPARGAAPETQPAPGVGAARRRYCARAALLGGVLIVGLAVL